jgi:hypothetical protein
MSNWITLTKDDLLGAFSALEVDRFSSIQLSSGQTADGVIAEEIEKITSYVRGRCEMAVRGGHLSALGPAGTIPSRLKMSALHILRVNIATRLPAMTDLIDELRQEQNKQALALLKEVAAGSFAAEDNLGDEATTTAVPTPAITPRVRNFSREAQDGI